MFYLEHSCHCSIKLRWNHNGDISAQTLAQKCPQLPQKVSEVWWKWHATTCLAAVFRAHTNSTANARRGDVGIACQRLRLKSHSWGFYGRTASLSHLPPRQQHCKPPRRDDGQIVKPASVHRQIHRDYSAAVTPLCCDGWERMQGPCDRAYTSLSLTSTHSWSYTERTEGFFLNMAVTSGLISLLSPLPPSLTLSNSLSLALLSFSAEVGWIPAQAEEIMQQHPIFRPCLIIWASPLHSAALASARSITGCMCYFIFFLLDLIVVKERTGFLFPVTSLPMLVVFRAAWERERPLWNEHVLMNILSPLYARNLY